MCTFLFLIVAVQKYFDTVPSMENQVLLSPQWIIDGVTYIVRDVQLHRFRRDRKAMELHGGAAWTDLVQRGILATPLLDSLWIDRSEHREFLLKLMCKLGLFAALPTPTNDGKVRYFVPSTVSAVVPRSLDSTQSALDVARRLWPEDSATPHKCTFDFQGFLPNGFFERIVNKLVSDWPAGYKGSDPHIMWNAAELCVSDPQYRLVLIADKENHTIQGIMAVEHSQSIVPHLEPLYRSAQCGCSRRRHRACVLTEQPRFRWALHAL